MKKWNLNEETGWGGCCCGFRYRGSNTSWAEAMEKTDRVTVLHVFAGVHRPPSGCADRCHMEQQLGSCRQLGPMRQQLHNLSLSLSLSLNRTPNDIRREQNNRRWQSRPKPPLLVSFEQFKWFLIKAEKSRFNCLPPKAYLKYRNWTFRSQIWKKFCFKVT